MIAFSLGGVAQEEKDKSAPNEQPRPDLKTSAFTGCYDLKLGRWWPWGFGEDDMFATPPNRIELLPERGTRGFEKNGFVIREMIPQNGDLRRSSFWQVKSSDQTDLPWATGFSGVTLELKRKGNDMRGWAHPFLGLSETPPHRARNSTADSMRCCSIVAIRSAALRPDPAARP